MKSRKASSTENSVEQALGIALRIVGLYRKIVLINGDDRRITEVSLQGRAIDQETYLSVVRSFDALSELASELPVIEALLAEVDLLRKRDRKRPLIITSHMYLAWSTVYYSAFDVVCDMAETLLGVWGDYCNSSWADRVRNVEKLSNADLLDRAFFQGRMAGLPWCCESWEDELRQEAMALLAAREHTPGLRAYLDLAKKDKWSEPNPPAVWAKRYDISWETLKKRIDEKKIRVKRLSSKSYRIHVDDLPAGERAPKRS